MRAGVVIEKKKTLPAKVKILEDQSPFEERIPPVRFRKAVPNKWLSIAITEGRNRRALKMNDAAGFPTLRLVKARIGKIQPGNLRLGEVRQIGISEFEN